MWKGGGWKLMMVQRGKMELLFDGKSSQQNWWLDSARLHCCLMRCALLSCCICFYEGICPRLTNLCKNPSSVFAVRKHCLCNPLPVFIYKDLFLNSSISCAFCNLGGLSLPLLCYFYNILIILTLGNRKNSTRIKPNSSSLILSPVILQCNSMELTLIYYFIPWDKAYPWR